MIHYTEKLGDKRWAGRGHPSSERGNIRHLGFLHQNHRPHWKVYGDGSATIEFMGNTKAGWVSLDITETPANCRGTHRTMTTLSRDEVERLRDYLTEILEGSQEEQEAA